MKGFGKSVPPELRHVQIYFLEKNIKLEIAQSFFEHYNSKGWKNKKGMLLNNWKSLAWDWIMKDMYAV